MNPTLRNILAVIIGGVVGMIVNMGIVMLGPNLIPTPEGYDPSTVESMKEGFHLLSPKHFLTPWLAHALGTLIGAFTTAKIAVSRHKMLSLFIGIFFLLGGISMIAMVPSPTWYTIIDLTGAYIPMAWLGYNLASRF